MRAELLKEESPLLLRRHVVLIEQDSQSDVLAAIDVSHFQLRIANSRIAFSHEAAYCPAIFSDEKRARISALHSLALAE